MRHSLNIQLQRLASDRWARRGVRLLLRAAILAISVWCLGLGARLAFAIDLPLTWIGAVALACIAGGALLALRPRMPAATVARRLDRRFHLNEQLSTALELNQEAEGVAVYLQEQSRRTVGQIRRHVAKNQRFPWSDAALLAALVLIAVGLLALQGLNPFTPAVAEPLPQPAQAADTLEQFPEEEFAAPDPQTAPAPGEQTILAPSDQATLAALADALRDQSLTRPAAEALDNGDTAEAAQILRELADQSDQISQEALDDLAGALRDAARQVERDAPDLAEQLRENAQALQSLDENAIAQGFEDLAGAIEDLGNGNSEQQAAPAEDQPAADGQNGAAAGAGAGDAPSSLPGSQREQSTERLGVDGVPLELGGDGEGGSPSEGQANSTGGDSNAGGFTQGAPAAPSTDRVQAGDDPLRIPAELRDVVQDYFSP
jgi:hypothetical protein